jgi:succinate dehydrogenase / fumarate reductase cytochrome b subunit
MAEIAQAATSTIDDDLARARPSFFWRRLHSLTGLAPVGFFMLFHLYENLGALRGKEAYDEGIAHLADLLPPPYFYLIELGVILLPIAYHGFYGALLSLDGSPNSYFSRYRRNNLYLLQRVTGLLALVYLAYHVISLRVQITMAGAGAGVPGHQGYVSFADMVRHYSDNWVVAWYAVGTLSCAFHFSNGLNGFCWTWGIAVGERSRKWVEVASWLLFAALSFLFLHILWSFRQ